MNIINSGGGIIGIYDSAIKLAVPFFFISSGFLLGKKMGQSFYEENSFNILHHYLRKTIKLYVIWSIVYLPLAIWDYIYISKDTQIIKVVLRYIRDLLFVGQHYNSWILWYLLSTIYTLIFLIFLFKKRIRFSIILIICGSIGIFGSTGLTWIVNNSDKLNTYLQIVSKLIGYSIMNGRILKGLFYIPLGIYLYQNRLSLYKAIITFIVGFCFMLLGNENIWIEEIGMAVCSLGLFNVVINISLRDSEKYVLFRVLSRVMYFSHLWIWSVYYFLKYGEKRYGGDCFCVTTLISIILGVCFYLYQKRVNRNNYL